MDRINRITKMTNAAAASLSPNGPDMEGGAALGMVSPERLFPSSLQAACETDRAAARVIFAILPILSILSFAVPEEAKQVTERTGASRDIPTSQVAMRHGVTRNPTASTGRPVHRMR